ncbi:hypothetical protein J6590_040932 [Homalodisca vitripennis]|nr:hypothetical protein J6590_040932 [Homalodisca vitripennis]
MPLCCHTTELILMQYCSLVSVIWGYIPTLSWPLGRVTKVIPDSYSVVRVVHVVALEVILGRNTVRVCPLPLN